VRTVIFALCVVLSACATKPASFYLSRPERPILPQITPDELQCLEYDVYARLSLRDKMRKWYAEELEAIIDSTRR
jgi:hypothetical protein